MKSFAYKMLLSILTTLVLSSVSNAHVSIYGKILDERGEAIQGARITIFAHNLDCKDPRVPPWTREDAGYCSAYIEMQYSDYLGQYATSGLEPGFYQVNVEHKDFYFSYNYVHLGHELINYDFRLQGIKSQKRARIFN